MDVADRGAPAQREIEDVERREAEATLKSDVAELKALWAGNLLVNSTANLVLTGQQLQDIIGAGLLRLNYFERRSSRVVIIGDIAVVSGNESSIMAQGEAAGDLLVCSYMNIWQRQEGEWKLVGRHLALIARTPAGSKTPVS